MEEERDNVDKEAKGVHIGLRPGEVVRAEMAAEAAQAERDKEVSDVGS
jgi:hypothetical protein